METRHPESNRGDRNVGNIYDRLDAARRKREQILDTPPPANEDRRTVTKPVPADRVFPKLKPPRTDRGPEGTVRHWDRVLPWLLGFAIFVLIFAFAVS